MSKRIYTGIGDKGKTGLLSGERVSKDHPRVEAYGTVDELITSLGVAKIYSSERIAKHIHAIQQILFYIAAELATDSDTLQDDDPILNLRRVNKDDVIGLERIADVLVEELPLLKNFVIPGGTKGSAFLHVARTVCRRAERRVISLSTEAQVNPEIVRFVNRLSDLLFVMARYENRESGEGDTLISRESD